MLSRQILSLAASFLADNIVASNILCKLNPKDYIKLIFKLKNVHHYILRI